MQFNLPTDTKKEADAKTKDLLAADRSLSDDVSMEPIKDTSPEQDLSTNDVGGSSGGAIETVTAVAAGDSGAREGGTSSVPVGSSRTGGAVMEGERTMALKEPSTNPGSEQAPHCSVSDAPMDSSTIPSSKQDTSKVTLRKEDVENIVEVLTDVITDVYQKSPHKGKKQSGKK